jgi:hypothetical protein
LARSDENGLADRTDTSFFIVEKKKRNAEHRPVWSTL